MYDQQDTLAAKALKVCMEAEENKKCCQDALDEATREEERCQSALQRALKQSTECSIALDQAKEKYWNSLREKAVIDSRGETIDAPARCLSDAMKLLYHPPVVQSSDSEL